MTPPPHLTLWEANCTAKQALFVPPEERPTYWDGLDPTRQERPEKTFFVSEAASLSSLPVVPQTHIGPLAKHIPVHKHQKDISASLSPQSYQNIHQSVFPVEFFSPTVLILLLFAFWIHFRCRLGSEVRRGRLTGFRRETDVLFLLHSLHASSSCPCRCVQLQWPPPLWQAPRPTIGRTLTPQVKDFGLCRKAAALCVCVCSAGPCYASFR